MRQAGQIIVSVVVLGVWTAHMLGVLKPWGDADTSTIGNALALVLGYWIGSSHGSDRKTDMLGGPK